MFIHMQDLKERIERVRESKNGDFTSEREFSEEMLEIRKAFVTIHGEMVLLKNYSSLNFAGNSLFDLLELWPLQSSYFILFSPISNRQDLLRS